MNNLPEPKIYIINLHNKEDRFIRTVKELRKVNLSKNITRIEATTSDEAKGMRFKYTTPDVYNNIETELKSTKIMPTWASLGCAISHINCWTDIAKDKLNYAVILEDDIIINDVEKFLYSYNNALATFTRKSTCHIIGLNSESNSKCNIIDNLYECYGSFYKTHCYIINLGAVNYLLNNICPLKYQIDIQLGLISNRSNNYLRCYTYIDSGIVQDDKLISTVQYYFLSQEDLINLFDLPLEILEIIYRYLPKREDFNNDIYESNHLYGY